MTQSLKTRVRYEDDFVAWADDQARLLRNRMVDMADLDNIAEELEGLSRSERRALESSLRLIILHMLKLVHQPERASQSWHNTIHRERLNLEDRLIDMPSLKPHLQELFIKAYVDGRRLASRETGISLQSLSEVPEFTLNQLRDPDFMPVAVTAGRHILPHPDSLDDE